MIVRAATRQDLLGIGRVAESAHWASYEGLLRPDTIGRLLARDFGPSALARSLLRRRLRVVSMAREVVGFVDSSATRESLHVTAIAVDPEARRRGIGTALLAEIGDADLGLPHSADVLLGNVEGEGFYEANGFVPGEIAHGRLFDEDVVERRWWREAEAARGGIERQVIGG